MLYSKMSVGERREMAARAPLCALCDVVFAPDVAAVVDHTHVTDEVRDILCRRCNARLGRIEGGWLVPTERDRAYLERHGVSVPPLREREHKRPKTESVMFALRMPGSFRETVKRIADKNHRSFNAEIIVAIEQHLRAEGKTSDPA